MATSDRSTWPGWARALTTGWVLSPIIVIALVAATFEGYGFYTRHQKTTYSRGGAFGATSEPAAQVHSTKVAGHHAKPGSKGHKAKVKNGGKIVTTLGTGGGAHQGGSSTSSQPSNTTHSQSGSSGPAPSHPTGSGSATPKPSKSATTNALVTPRVGEYTLAVSGEESAKFGPISACHNTFPSRATLDVHHAAGESPTSYDFDMRMYPGQANRHDERHIYKYSKSAMILTYEEETVTCSGIKQSSTVDYSPAQVRVELPLTVGRTWHNHGGGSARTETGTSTVVKRTSLTVQGTSYQVYEIATKLALTGNETGERDQVWWYSPQLAMPLRFSETLHGNRSGAKYSESYTASVVGIP
jgi:hypothetical protein